MSDSERSYIEKYCRSCWAYEYDACAIRKYHYYTINICPCRKCLVKAVCNGEVNCDYFSGFVRHLQHIKSGVLNGLPR